MFVKLLLRGMPPRALPGEARRRTGPKPRLMAAHPLDWRQIVLRGTLAGLAGAIVFGLFLYAAATRAARPGSPSAEYVLLYFGACLAWGFGYVYLARTNPNLDRLPALSGIVFGVVVYVVVQLVLYSVNVMPAESAWQVALGMVATCLFFGLPVALVSRFLSRPA